MSFAEFSKYLHKLNDVMPELLSSCEKKEDIKSIVEQLKELIPVVEKEVDNAQVLLNAFAAWQKENNNLQNILSSLSGQSSFILSPKTIASSSESISEKNVEPVINSSALDNSKVSTLNIDISPKTSDLLNEIPTDISTPKSIHESYTSHIDSANLNKNDFYTESETMDMLQVDIGGLEGFISEKKITPTMIDGERYFSKRKVTLLRSTAMELSTIVVSKTKKSGLFGKEESYTVQNADIPNMDDYYTENETMDELQLDMEGLEGFIAEKKITPTMIDGKRYFSKRKVTLVRSTTMELNTIVIKKPKKSSLKFWEND